MGLLGSLILHVPPVQQQSSLLGLPPGSPSQKIAMGRGLYSRGSIEKEAVDMGGLSRGRFVGVERTMEKISGLLCSVEEKIPSQSLK